MAETNRFELLSTVTKKDVDGLSDVTEKLHNGKILADTIVTLNKRQRTELWDGVLSMCMATLLDTPSEETDGSNAQTKMYQILSCITNLAAGTLAALKQADGGSDEDDGQEAEIDVPPSLHETAIILHGILPTLESQRSGLKNSLSLLFESWWTNRLPGREELMANTLIYLVDRSTQPDSAKQDVARVMSVHQVLTAVDLSKESAAPLVTLLLQCSHHPHFVTSPKGMQFLSFLFTLDKELAQRLHESIKTHPPSVPGAWGSKYGEIYFRAWQKSSGEQREHLELNCIQDFMHCACRMRMGARGSLWFTLYKILNCFHGKKTQRGVEDMLCRLYEPILWRSLMVCNSDIRQSSAHVMFSAFPLQNSALHNEEADAALQRQFDAMHNLLQDPVPAVRLAAVEGVSKVLSIYWELIPLDVIKCFITALVEDLAYDITSPSVREAVIKVMYQLCDNHLALPVLSRVLPSLHNFVHDTSERVRTAMLDLLLKLKGLRAIKFYTVVSVEHLLARLDVETSEPVARRIMRLLFRSFVPTQEAPQQQLERCKALILSNQGAARQFYLRLPEFLDQEDTVKYMVVLCRFMVESARQLNNTSRTEDAENNDGDEAEGQGQATPAGATPRRSSRSSAKRSRNCSGTPSGAEVNDDADDENRDPSDQDDHQSLTTVLRGAMEALYLMYITLAPRLAANPELRPMSEGLAKKLSVTVREVMAVSQDPDLDTTLVSLAGHLPSKTLPLASQSLLNKLRRLKPGKDNSKELTTAVKALVQWGKANLLLEMVRESLHKVMNKESSEKGEEEDGNEGQSSSSNERKKEKQPKKKKKTVGFSAPDEDDDSLPWEVAVCVLETMLSQCECRPILRARHGQSLLSVAKSLQATVGQLRQVLSLVCIEREDDEEGSGTVSLDLSLRLYTVHLRICAFLCCKPVRREEQTESDDRAVGEGDRDREGASSSVYDEAVRAIVTAVTWGSTCLLPWLKSWGGGSENSRSEESSSPSSSSGRSSGNKGRKKGRKLEENDCSPSAGVKKKIDALTQLLTFVLKVASGVMIAGNARPALVDEAVQLCMALLRPSKEVGGLPCPEPSVLTAALGCVYQLLSLRVVGGEGDPSNQVVEAGNTEECARKATSSSSASSSVEKNRYREIACSCVCLFLKSLSPSPLSSSSTSEENSSAIEGNGLTTEKFGEKEYSSGKKDQAGKGASRKVANVDLIKSVSPLLSELVLELIRIGRTDASVAQKTVAAALESVLADTNSACEREEEGLDGEGEVQLPPLASAVMAVVKRRAFVLKLFCSEVETYLSLEDTITIHQLQALLAVAMTIKSYNGSLLTTEFYTSLESALAKAARPTGMDEDVFKDLKSKTGERMKKLSANQSSAGE